MKRLLAVSALSLALLGGRVQATLVYSDDFDGHLFVAPGVAVSGPTGGSWGTATGAYGGSDGKSWSGTYFNSLGNSSTLTLSGLGAHTQIRIDMMLGFLNSWDSDDAGGTVSPDYLDVYVDNVRLLHMTTTNSIFGSNVDFNGGTQVVNDGQIDGYVFYADDLVDMATAPALTFDHSASTLTLTITPSGSGWQGWIDEGWGPDEGWGMDDLRIYATGGVPAVPEPAVLAFLGLGLAGLGFRRKRAAL